VLLGNAAAQHPQASSLLSLANWIGAQTGATVGYLTEAANTVGAQLVGALPGQGGLNAAEMLAKPLKAYLLFNTEPVLDAANAAQAAKALAAAEMVVAFSPFQSTRAVADVILPIGALPEIDATLTNLDGIEQQAVAAGKLPGLAHSGWRVLRALGGDLALPGFEFTDLTGLRAGLAPKAVQVARGASASVVGNGLEVAGSAAIYRVDAVIRRCDALQAHPLNGGPRAALNPADASALGLAEGVMAKCATAAGTATLQVAIDPRVAPGSVWVESGYGATAPLLAAAKLEVARA